MTEILLLLVSHTGLWLENRNLVYILCVHTFCFSRLLLNLDVFISHCDNVMCPFTGGALPALAQLAVSTYHTANASSHAAISGITMRVEERGTNHLMPQLRESSHQSPVNQKSWFNSKALLSSRLCLPKLHLCPTNWVEGQSRAPPSSQQA